MRPCPNLPETLADPSIARAGDPATEIQMADIVGQLYRRGHQVIGRGEAPQSNEPPFRVQIVAVEVDMDTGEAFVGRVVAAHDAGRAINPQIVEGVVVRPPRSCRGRTAGLGPRRRVARSRQAG